MNNETKTKDTKRDANKQVLVYKISHLDFNVLTSPSTTL
jgi:hypothetical protein